MASDSLRRNDCTSHLLLAISPLLTGVFFLRVGEATNVGVDDPLFLGANAKRPRIEA
jgi:hypothetical protein